jgi:hypothetical protein
MEPNLSGLSNNVNNVLGFNGKDEGIVKFNAMSRVEAVFSYSTADLSGSSSWI